MIERLIHHHNPRELLFLYVDDKNDDDELWLFQHYNLILTLMKFETK